MGERLGMQSESWRPQRDGRGFDPQITRMAVIAGAVLGVLAIGYGGYSLIGHGPRIVPVVEADSRPVRVKPDNPGGMQVAGAEEQIMGDAASSQAATMAPATEVPQPQVLRAQIQAARQPAPPPLQTASLSAPPAPTPPPAISAMPEQRVAVPLPARPQVARPPAVVTGGTEVQLAAMDTEAAAMAEWQHLTKRMPDLLSGRHPAVQRAERNGKPLFRLRTGGFVDVAQATAFCTQVRSKGGGCTIASF